jgi:molybdopterin/thiamine biosynthesis adenylyltransferase
MLTSAELERYDRQIMIYGFGEEGQEKLKSARVFIAGAGGLGSPVAIYLAAAGVGTLRIVDHDTIELSNLNRQVLHWDENIGEKKVDTAAAKLKKLNPNVRVEAIAETITGASVSHLVAD